MKIKVETTLHLSEYQVACVKAYMDDLGATDETLREFVKSLAESYAGHAVEQAVIHYGEYVE